MRPSTEAGEGTGRGLILYTGAAEWQEHSPKVETVRDQFDGIKVQLLTSGPLALFAQQLPDAKPVNLLQGRYAPQNTHAVGWQAWRVAAMLLVGLIVLHVAGKAGELYMLKRAEKTVDASSNEETGGVLVPPFDHPDIIAGQGTIGLEIAEDLPAVENVLVPVSGGGLASGIGTAIKALCPHARVFGVEPELAADTAEGLGLGHRVDWSIGDRNRTIADGLRSQPSDLTFAHLQKVLDGVITVSENEIRAAVRELAQKAHLVSEPSGAVALAAYRQESRPAGPTVMILSGGNIGPEMLQEILAG